MNKTIKCLISLMLVFSMIFTTMVGSVSAALTVADIVDVEDPQFDIVNLLVKLGVFKEGDEFPSSMSESITRAEFVEYAMRLHRYADVDVSGTTELRYTDVDSSHKYYKTILLAAALNVLSYDENDLTFKPDDYITFDEGLAVVINAAGYKEYALHTGEYPSSYRVLATQLGLFDKLDTANNDGIMTYETACQLLFNAFTAPLFEVASTSQLTGETFWQINENKSILSEKHNIYEVEGILTANDVASILPGVPAERGTARIGNTLFYNDNTDEAVYDYLGYNVRAFYYDDEGRRELIYVGTIDKHNKVFTLEKDDISDIRKVGSDVIISYWDENDRIESITITPSTSVLFNDKAYDSPVIYKEWFNINNGEIVFLDNGGTNDYDVAFIYEYNTVVVDSVNVENKYIYDIDDATLNIDLNHSANSAYYSIVDVNGNKVELSALKEGDVLSVAQSADRKVTKMKLSQKSENAVISAKDTTDRKIIIGTKTYDAGERIDLANISLGEPVKVYYDVFDNAVYVEKVEVETGKNLAYLVTIDRSGRSNLSRDVDVLLVKAKSDETSIFRLAETLKVDGETVKSYTLLTEGTNQSIFESQNVVKQQVISYSVNDNNEINYIDTASLGAEEDPEITLSKRHNLSDSALYLKSGYMATRGSSNIKFAYNSSKSTVFYIPTDRTDYDSFESNSKSLADEGEKKCDVYTYGNISVVPVALVLQESSGDSAGAIDEYAVPYYLEKILYTVYKDKDGEEQVGRKLCLVDTDGKSTSVILPEENENFTSATKWTAKNTNPNTANLSVVDAVGFIDVGDILVHAVDTNGYLSNIQVLYDWDANAVVDGAYTPNGTGYQGLRAYHFGQVYHKENGYYSISPNTSVLTDNDQSNDSQLQIKPFPLAENATVNIFNVENGKLKFKAGTKKDVIDYKTYGSEATLSFVNARYASPQKKLFFKNHTGAGTTGDANFGKYPAYFVESDTNADVIATRRADAGATITIPDNTKANGTKLEITGFNFLGWTDGQNTYAAGSTYVMPEATVIFYPVFGVANSVTFDENAPAGSTVEGTAPSVGNYAEGQTFTVPANTFNIFGYEFIKWNDGTNDYVPGDTYTMPSGPVTFTAVWEAGEVATFDNGVSSISVREGRDFVIPEMTGSIRGQIFDHWTDGVNTYYPGDTYTMPAGGVTFTSVWNAGAAIDFVYNSKTDSLTVAAVGDEVILPSESDLAGYEVEGWTADNGTTILAPGSTYALASASETLKAVYSKYLRFTEWYFYGKDGTISNSGTLGRGNGTYFLTTLDISGVDMEMFKAYFGFDTKFQNTGYCKLHIKPVNTPYSFAVGSTVNINALGIGSDLAVTSELSADPRTADNKVAYRYGEFEADISSYLKGQREIGKTTVQLAMNNTGSNSDDCLRNTPSTAFVKLYVLANASPITAGQLRKATFVGGTGVTGTAPADVEQAENSQITLPASTFTKEGYRFAGWNDGTTIYNAGDTYTFGAADVEFTAQWVKTYTVTFANGDSSATGTIKTPPISAQPGLMVRWSGPSLK